MDGDKLEASSFGVQVDSEGKLNNDHILIVDTREKLTHCTERR